jgi:polyisoprenoid-binding protein YceI
MKERTNWNIDHNNSEIRFTLRHWIISQVQGSFGTFRGSIVTESESLSTAEINLWIDTTSVSTSHIKRDEFLAGPDFLNANHYPKIIFISKTIEKLDRDGNYEIFGELQIKNRRENIQLNMLVSEPMDGPTGKKIMDLYLTGEINRKDWGLTWKNVMNKESLMVGKTALINIHFQISQPIYSRSIENYLTQINQTLVEVD